MTCPTAPVAPTTPIRGSAMRALRLRALELEHPDLLPYYRGIKQLFDPNGIMNPGKVVASEDPLLA